jgi:hypothetical protein
MPIRSMLFTGSLHHAQPRTACLFFPLVPFVPWWCSPLLLKGVNHKDTKTRRVRARFRGLVPVVSLWCSCFVGNEGNHDGTTDTTQEK